MRKTIVALLLGLMVTAGVGHGGPPRVPVAVAVPLPESVYWDSPTYSWFVSSLGVVPDPAAKDGDGFIGRLRADGSVITERWVEGLDTPKGMRRRGGKLFVADVDQVRVIDIATATIVQSIQLPGAVVTNDVAVDHDTGKVYVTDWLGDKVYVLEDSPDGMVPGVFLDTSELESPNGIIVDDGALILATWGPDINPTTLYSTSAPGYLLRVDIATKEISRVCPDRIANLDGIEKDGDDYLVTDWPNGRLLRLTGDCQVQTVLQFAPSTADIGFSPGMDLVAVPNIFTSLVVFTGA